MHYIVDYLKIGIIIPNMSNDIQSVILSAAIKILRPLVRVFLRNGVACGDFVELVKKSYVDEAFAMSKGKSKVTVSSVSAQSGLSRKEVKRLHDIDGLHDGSTGSKYNRAVRVISGWTNDKRFTSPSGVPLPLPMEQGDNSFAILVKDYSGDIPTKAMLNLLEASDCVETTEGLVYLISHAYVPGNDSTDVIDILGTDTNELIETIDHNLTCTESERRFQRKVSNSLVSESAAREFETYASNRSQALLEELDAWLSEHEIEKDGEDAKYISVGIYYFDKNPDEEL